MATSPAQTLSVVQILSNRLAVLSAQDTESRARTAKVLKELQATAKMLEDLGDWEH